MAFQEKANKIAKSLHELSEKRQIEILSMLSSDSLYEAIQQYFEIGNEFTFIQTIDIVREGVFRYSHKIPPGYEDVGQKGKDGLPTFGDLVLWTQLLACAKEKDKPIIFVSNETKADWVDKRDKIKLDWIGERANIPRFELIKEFYDVSNKRFWLFNLSDFLFHINAMKVGASVDGKVLDEVRHQQTVKEESMLEAESQQVKNERPYDDNRHTANDDTQYKKIDEKNLVAELSIAQDRLPFVGIRRFCAMSNDLTQSGANSEAVF